MLSHGMAGLGRVRGTLLRMVRRRSLSVVVGALLVAPAVWVEVSSAGVPWWVEGVSVVMGGTGAALIWAGVRGPRPDWLDTQ